MDNYDKYNSSNNEKRDRVEYSFTIFESNIKNPDDEAHLFFNVLRENNFKTNFSEIISTAERYLLGILETPRRENSMYIQYIVVKRFDEYNNEISMDGIDNFIKLSREIGHTFVNSLRMLLKYPNDEQMEEAFIETYIVNYGLKGEPLEILERLKTAYKAMVGMISVRAK